LATFSADQVSKWIVLRELAPPGSRQVEIVPGVLRLIYVRNTGSAFGLFQGRSEILKVLAVIAILALAAYFARVARGDRLLSAALGLQLGGALGNIVDRFRHGFVIDWIDVPHWPTFNIADSAITVGAVLLVYALLVRDELRRFRAYRQQRSMTPTAGEDG
jgi:signal peptidase II